MTKKEYLIERLIDQAHVISITGATANQAELADDIIRFMAIVHLCGQEELLEPRSPKEAGDLIQKYQDEAVAGFDGIWNGGPKWVG